MSNWMENIADAHNRHAARQHFEEWLTMKDDVHDEIAFTGRHNDVGTLIIDTSGTNNHIARDLAGQYGAPGTNPVRLQALNGVAPDQVELRFLLAHLTTDNGTPMD